jgi:hypothetical protein
MSVSSKLASISRGLAAGVTSPHPNSGLPEFGTLSWPKSDIFDLGGERSAPKAPGEGDKVKSGCVGLIVKSSGALNLAVGYARAKQIGT